MKETEFWGKGVNWLARRKRPDNVAAVGEETAVKIRLKDGSDGWSHYEVI